MTGLQQTFTTVAAAAAWAGSSHALPLLTTQAVGLLQPDSYALPEQWAQAAEALILFGELLPVGTVADARCYCGGFLADQGEWVHVWTCIECEHRPGEPCPDDTATHRLCTQPSPVICDHPHCRRPNSLTVLPCEYDHESCCGCCTDR